MSNSDQKIATIIATAVTSIIIGGCSTTSSIPPTPRYLGFSETVTQDGKQLYAGAELMEHNRVAVIAQLQSAGQVSQTMATTVQMTGFKQAIIRRDLPSKGFEGNFGHETDIVFRFQPCNQVAIQNLLPECMDQPPSQPTVIRKKISLVGNEKVTIQFPEGVLWTYQVLDQASPLVSN